MANNTTKPASAVTRRRLDTLRGGAPARGHDVRALAAYARHADCPLATLGFVARVNFDRLLAGTPYQASFGQSPFAFARGKRFEELLREQEHTPLSRLLSAGGVRLTGTGVVNLRTREPLEERARRTLAVLDRVRLSASGAPCLLDGPVLRGEVGGIPAYFEADFLVAEAGPRARVVEVKSFPVVDGRVDADKLGAALDQAATYALLLRGTGERAGWPEDWLVSDSALLVTPRNLGFQPMVSEHAIGRRRNRVAAILASVPRADEVAASLPARACFGPVADPTRPPQARLDVLHELADAVGTAYRPGCLSDCGNARFCRERAFRRGDACLTGEPASRLMPGVTTLARADDLSRGAPPTPAEAPAAALLARAGRLYEAVRPSRTTDLERRIH